MTPLCKHRDVACNCLPAGFEPCAWYFVITRNPDQSSTVLLLCRGHRNAEAVLCWATSKLLHIVG
jgi:hypothetical protein